MGTERRDWLKAMRAEKGLTQDALARRIQVDPGTVARWERGAQEIRVANQGPLAEALGVTVRQLISHLRPTPPKPSTQPVPDTPTNVAIRSLRSVIDGCRGLDHTVGPVGTLDIVRSQLAVGDRLRSMAANDNERKPVVAMMAEIRQFEGWMNFDMGNVPTARTAHARAREMAEAADDSALVAYILGPSAAFIEIDSGHPKQGLDLAYASQARARRSGNRRLIAFTLAISARAHAKLGEDRICDQLLNEAANELAAHNGWATDPVWLNVFDETALTGHTGSCYLDLGRPSEAVDLLSEQDNSSSAEFVRNRAIWWLDRAAGYQAMNEIEQAATELTNALDLISTTSSPRTRKKLQTVSNSLTEKAQNHPSVIDLTERIAHLDPGNEAS